MLYVCHRVNHGFCISNRIIKDNHKASIPILMYMTNIRHLVSLCHKAREKNIKKHSYLSYEERLGLHTTKYRP